MILPAVSISNEAFRHLVILYPLDLRREFEEDLVEVFSQQIETAWEENAWRGIAGAWLNVLVDYAAITLPYVAARLAVPVLTAVISSVWFTLALTAINPSR
jgi:hypothetical protein